MSDNKRNKGTGDNATIDAKMKWDTLPEKLECLQLNLKS